MQGNPASFDINRPTRGLVGSALADEAVVVTNFLDAIADSLDAGEGWITRTESTLTWFVSRLAVTVTRVDDDDATTALRCDIRVVTGGGAPSFDLLNRVNELNTHAVGWWFWIDDQSNSVVSSMSCPVRSTDWWWCWYFILTIPTQATVAESIADELAAISGGRVAIQPHPDRGIRQEVDGWVRGARLGAREPSSSLDIFLTTLDYNLLRRSLAILEPGATVDVSIPLDVQLAGNTGYVRSTVSRRWHPEHGWGWQFATVAAPPIGPLLQEPPSQDQVDALVAAAEWNESQAADNAHAPLFGGWVAVPGVGLIHHTFIPAFVLEYIVTDAGETFGSVLGLMVAQLGQFEPNVAPAQIPTTDPDEANGQLWEALDLLHNAVGPRGWAYTQDAAHQPVNEVDDPSGEAIWTAGRAICVCSFGNFNPAGPTASSLEISIDPRHWTLYYVRRHPFAPLIEELGVVSWDDPFGAMNQLISDSLADVDDGVFGSGPVWLDITHDGFRDGVLDGARRFARAVDVDLAFRADDLIHYSADPWARVNKLDGDLAHSQGGLSNPVEYWVSAITDREVIAGHQLFLRSAWEGAKAMVASGFEAAAATSDSLASVARNRAMSDYVARGEQGLLVQHPLTTFPRS